MSQILTLALKDLRILSRDWFGLFWIFVFPLLYALFFGSIMGGGEQVSALTVAVADEDRSPGSADFIQRLKENTALVVELMPRAEARARVRKGQVAAYLVLKPGFGEAAGFFSSTRAVVELGVDPRRKAEAGMLQGLVMKTAMAGMQKSFSDPARSRAQLRKATDDIDKDARLPPAERRALKNLFANLDRFFREVDLKTLKEGPKFSMEDMVEVVDITREGTRPASAFEITFPSAVIWAIMGCLASFSISLVTERRAGTFLRLRLAPLSWSRLLAGKGLACFLACVGVAGFLLLFGHFLFGVRLENPLALVLGVLATGVCFVGLMMLFATLGKTEQGVAGATWGILMPLAMLGGGMIPLIAMPPLMQALSKLSPIGWAIIALEGAIWRDFSLAEMLVPCAILIAVGAICFALGVKNLARMES
jgi:ABC-2 type transport system permease protein